MTDAPKVAVTPSHRVTVAPPRDGRPVRIADVVLEKPRDVSKPSVAAAPPTHRPAR